MSVGSILLALGWAWLGWEWLGWAGLGWAWLGWAWLGAAVLMAGLWWLQCRTRNAGIVDFGWALSLGLMAAFYGMTGSGHSGQRWLMAVIVGAWSARLSLHLLLDRLIGQPEDGRYVALRQHFGVRADLHFIWFFQAQAMLAAALSLPFLLASANPAAPWHPLQVLALAVVLAGVVGEGVADRQLAAFRADPGNRGRTCRRGLWRFSRHPNYFFEWLVWCGFALLATPAPHGWLAWSAPLILLGLITKVTGIPYTEAQALRSRGDDYRDYQATTNAFFPGPVRPRPTK